MCGLTILRVASPLGWGLVELLPESVDGGSGLRVAVAARVCRVSRLMPIRIGKWVSWSGLGSRSMIDIYCPAGSDRPSGDVSRSISSRFVWCMCGGSWKAGERRTGAVRIRGGNSARLLGGAGSLLCSLHASDSGGVGQRHVGCAAASVVTIGMFPLGIFFLLAGLSARSCYLSQTTNAQTESSTSGDLAPALLLFRGESPRLGSSDRVRCR